MSKGIFFDEQTSTFRLYCKDSLYAFVIGPHLSLEHVYWGPSIRQGYDMRYMNENCKVLQFSTVEHTRRDVNDLQHQEAASQRSVEVCRKVNSLLTPYEKLLEVPPPISISRARSVPVRSCCREFFLELGQKAEYTCAVPFTSQQLMCLRKLSLYQLSAPRRSGIYTRLAKDILYLFEVKNEARLLNLSKFIR